MNSISMFTTLGSHSSIPCRRGGEDREAAVSDTWRPGRAREQARIARFQGSREEKTRVLAMERRMLMTTTASRGTLRVTVRAASLLGAAAPALLAMFRPVR